MECELPNSRIHHFNGVLRHDLEGGRETPVDVSNLLLRGSSVRNTKWILGLVVYTGRDTKLVQNSRCVFSGEIAGWIGGEGPWLAE